MTIKTLYDTVTLTKPCTHNEFLTHVDTTIRTLIAKYGMNYVCYPHSSYLAARYVEDDIPVYDDYYPAVLDNVLFLLTGDEAHKVDYVNNSDSGYKMVWRRKVVGKCMRDRRFI